MSFCFLAFVCHKKQINLQPIVIEEVIWDILTGVWSRWISNVDCKPILYIWALGLVVTLFRQTNIFSGLDGFWKLVTVLSLGYKNNHYTMSIPNATRFQRQAIRRSTPDATWLCNSTKSIKNHSQSEACVSWLSLEAHSTPSENDTFVI